MSGDDPFEKIIKYIDEQRKMPHVATNIALKELTWPPKSRKVDSPPKDLGATFPSASASKDKPAQAPAQAPASEPAPSAAAQPAPEKIEPSPEKNDTAADTAGTGAPK